MKKICVALVMVAMLVCIFAPGVSARSRPLWMDQLQNRADKPQGDEGGWGVETQTVEPERSPWIYWISTSIRSFFSPVPTEQKNSAQEKNAKEEDGQHVAAF